MKLTVSHRAVRRGLRTVLEGQDIEMPAPVVAGVVGVNGSGKTSLFMHLAGALLWSRPVAPLSIDDRTPRCAWVPQDSPLPPWLRAEDVASLHGLDFNRIMEAMPGMLLHEIAGRTVRTLSAGQRQALAFALAIAANAELTLLDEPFAALDFRRQAAARALVAGHRASGRSVLLSSQSAADLAALCDHFIVLRGGRCVFNGSRDALLGDRLHATVEERLLELLT